MQYSVKDNRAHFAEADIPAAKDLTVGLMPRAPQSELQVNTLRTKETLLVENVWVVKPGNPSRSARQGWVGKGDVAL